MSASAGGRIAESTRALRSSFANPGLRRLQLAWLGSVVGHWSYLVALSVYAFDQGGAGAVGLLWVIRLVPAAVLSPVLATFADRYRRERVMVISNLICASMMAAITALVAVDAAAWIVYAAAVGATIARVVFRPAQAALLPRLARDPEELTAANAASSTIESVAFFAGPALAGLLLAATGPEIVFALNGALFVWSAALVLGVRASRAEREAETVARPGFVSELSRGAGTIARAPRIATITGLYTVQTLVAGATNVLVVVAAFDLLDAGEAGVGYLNAALGAGAFLGGLAALALAARDRLASDLAVGLVLCGAPLAALGVVSGLPVALVAMVLVGIGNAIVDVLALTLLQRSVSDDVLGRVLGTLEGMLLGAMGIGAVLAPALVDAAGAEAALVIAGLVLPAVTLLAVPALRAIDRTAGRPEHTELFRHVPFLAVLPEPVLEHLVRTAAPVRASAGEPVLRKGDPGDLFYVIETGEVEIEGRRFGPGESFGEIALLRDTPRTTAVTAITDVVLQAVDREGFLAAVTGHEPARASAESVVAARLGGLSATMARP